MNFFSKKSKWVGVEAPTTQKAYVDTRLVAIAGGSDLEVQETLEMLAGDLEAWVLGRQVTPPELREAYEKIKRNLQGSDLTINFKPKGWFSSPNHSETYSQMYERGVQDDGQVLIQETPMNPFRMRARADDMVTIPQEWDNLQPVQRGLAPGQGAVRMRDALKFGEAAGVKEGNRTKYTTQNEKFNAKAKQVFAALNYGNRAHGAAPAYGKSFFLLKPELKPRAIYYPNDTFGLKDSRTASQTSFEQIGTIYMKTKYLPVNPEPFRQNVLRACYRGIPLEDELASGDMLLEAHIFGEVRFSGSVLAVNICRDPAEGLNPQQWQVVIANARAFAKKHRLRFNLVS